MGWRFTPRFREYPGDILSCAKCGRAGQYQKRNLVERYGADIRLPDLRWEISQCGRHGQMHDACRYVDLIPKHQLPAANSHTRRVKLNARFGSFSGHRNNITYTYV